MSLSTSAASACIISGGSAANDILDGFTSCFDRCAFVLPVSDNGGSSAEIIRVLGGPSLGDIRSRLVRLIPDEDHHAGIRALFSHRLPNGSDGSDQQAIKKEWLDIVEGSHPLWRDIPPDRREAIRAFLVHFEHAILRRAQRRFDFRSGSIGNFWLAGVQLFVRSLQSAIFLFSSVCGVSSKYSVIPAINTNSLVTIAAELADGSRIVGQNEISHPSPGSEQPLHGSYTPSSGNWTPALDRSGSRLAHREESHPQMGEDLDYDDSSGVLARTEHDLSLENDTDQGETAWDQPRRDEQPHHTSNIIFSKSDDDWPPLPARISRIIYLNTYGQETFPAPSSAYLQSLQSSDYLIYSCGSLYTSLIPQLALSGVGNAIAMSKFKAKILLLNGSFDRETDNMTAVDFIEAVTSHLNGSIRSMAQKQPMSMHLHPDLYLRPVHRFAASDCITHVLYLQSASIQVDQARLRNMNIQAVAVPSDRFSSTNLSEALRTVLSAS